MTALATPPAPALPAEAEQLLRQTFGLADFRDGQEAVLARLLSGRSSLAIFPTGGGKSLCYQLPALMLDGLTVVVSPLIALMKDQIDFLTRRQIPAVRLDSSLDRDAAQQAYADLRAGRTRILYVSPERLGNERFLQLLERQSISLLAVDEAHCISEWGHNFRPDYLKIATLAQQLGVGRVLALTATATPQVAADIARAFDIEPDDVVQTGFYRPNLELRVSPTTGARRMDLLVRRLRTLPPGPTIVYVTHQRTAEEVAGELAKQGFSARPYHAGLGSDVRSEVQEAFMAADDRVVVATIAFGMGIDKANIRRVIHFNLPKSLEGYMQEIGRAGRDGEPAICELLFCRDDVEALENFATSDTPTAESVAALINEILGLGERFDVAVYDLAKRHGARELVVRTLLTYLELEGVLQSTGPFYSEFRFQPQRPSKEILAQFDAQRAEFLGKLFRQARRGKTWFTIDADAASRKLGEPRERIVAALDYLEQRGDMNVKASGVRHGYRRKTVPSSRPALIETIAERFIQREAHDLERVGQVVGLAEHKGCLTGYLLEHFGESRPACGHCGGCKSSG